MPGFEAKEQSKGLRHSGMRCQYASRHVKLMFCNSNQLNHQMVIEPLSARYTAETTPEGLRVFIPSRQNWLIILFLMAWLGGWVFGEVNAASELLSGNDKTPVAFLIFWLAGWTVGGVACIFTVLWQLAGREVLTITASELAYRIEMFGLGWTRAYRKSEVKHLRATEYSTNAFSNQRAWFPPLTGSGYGPIAFDYGARTIRFAPTLDEAEAKMLVGEIEKRMPRGPNA